MPRKANLHRLVTLSIGCALISVKVPVSVSYYVPVSLRLPKSEDVPISSKNVSVNVPVSLSMCL